MTLGSGYQTRVGDINYPQVTCVCLTFGACATGGGLQTVQAQYGIKTPSDLFSFSHTRNAARMETDRIGALRTVSARPRGVLATVNEQVQAWEESTGAESGKDSELRNHPRIGIGLPMSNICAKWVPRVRLQ